MLQPTFVEIAPAKINLYLHITGVREGGLHELSSLVVFADISDRVTALATSDNTLTLNLDGPFGGDLSAGEDNLVLKAARLLAERAGMPAGGRLTLEKNLPVASGIGGGSADAAATLRALVGAWGLDDGKNGDAVTTLTTLWGGLEHLHLDLAAQLGADVPVCLRANPQMVAGIGERLSPAPALAPLWVVLANPLQAVSTAGVFEDFQQSGVGFSTARPLSQSMDNIGQLVRELAARQNDLEAPATRLEPAARAVLSRLEALDGQLLSRMSGSGATGFALFDGEAGASRAATELAGLEPRWWVVAAAVLGTNV